MPLPASKTTGQLLLYFHHAHGLPGYVVAKDTRDSGKAYCLTPALLETPDQVLDLGFRCHTPFNPAASGLPPGGLLALRLSFFLVVFRSFYTGFLSANPLLLLINHRLLLGD